MQHSRRGKKSTSLKNWITNKLIKNSHVLTQPEFSQYQLSTILYCLFNFFSSFGGNVVLSRTRWLATINPYCHNLRENYLTKFVVSFDLKSCHSTDRSHFMINWISPPFPLACYPDFMSVCHHSLTLAIPKPYLQHSFNPHRPTLNFTQKIKLLCHRLFFGALSIVSFLIIS